MDDKKDLISLLNLLDTVVPLLRATIPLQVPYNYFLWRQSFPLLNKNLTWSQSVSGPFQKEQSHFKNLKTSSNLTLQFNLFHNLNDLPPAGACLSCSSYKEQGESKFFSSTLPLLLSLRKQWVKGREEAGETPNTPDWCV